MLFWRKSDTIITSAPNCGFGHTSYPGSCLAPRIRYAFSFSPYKNGSLPSTMPHCIRRAPLPVTIGAAKEVPVLASYPPPFLGAVIPKFELREKPEPKITDARDAIVRVTLGSICTSDLHIKHGSVPRAVPGITVGHEMVGVVEEVGAEVTSVRPGDRVTVNVETFCGECFFCHHGYVNNCTDPNGGWALGCRIDGGQAEYVRVPYADQGLNRIPDTVSDEQALFVGDVLATGFWATRISEITEKDTVLLIGAGPTGICTLLCSMLKNPKRIIVCEKSPERIRFVREHYPDVLITTPENCKEFVLQNSDHGGADVVLEVAGTEDSFRMAWDCARPNAIVTIVALYDKPLLFPLPEMYGKNLTFKTGGVDGCDCAEILSLIEEGKIDTTPLITHRCSLNEIEEAYRIFENKLDGVIKVAIVCQTESNK